eukprot:TRINITY_DN6326_c0_g1_i2.p1 TRINITY_DN6326_c0_g1~~TRINITY_DN6326_c0_g1_i2.p1  ORF type:complete len:715 (+),score=129.77 TRINITY_DN6326_c0_g1_i2:145-2289(+)
MGVGQPSSWSQTGLTVAVLRWTGSQVERNAIEEIHTFNTMRSSQELVTYLDSLANGTMALMSVADSACCRLSAAAKAKIEDFGASMIHDLRFRSSYALIGIKGGAAMGEELRAEGEGMVSLAAEIDIADPGLRPLCDARVDAPPVKGILFEGSLVLDAGCQYALQDVASLRSNLAGSWIVINGGSNMLLMFHRLAMMLAPGEYGRFYSLWNSYVVDIVIENAKIVSFSAISSKETACRQVDHNISSRGSCEGHVAARLSQAPPHSDDKNQIRLTIFLNRFWHLVPGAVDLVQADAGWSSARLAFVVQVSTWYTICNVEQFGGCLREDLKEADVDLIQVFQSEMNLALEKLRTTCSPGGRAGSLGCAVGTGAWTNAGGPLGASMTRLNTEIASAMQTRSSTTFRFLDFFTLGAAMPQETILGHGSQILHTWAWQILLGGFFSLGSEVAQEAEPKQEERMVFQGTLCSAANSSLEHCQDYVDWCSQWNSCNLWMCMNSEKCEHSIVPSSRATTALAGPANMTTTTAQDIEFTSAEQVPNVMLTGELATVPQIHTTLMGIAIGLSVCCSCLLLACSCRFLPCLRRSAEVTAPHTASDSKGKEAVAEAPPALPCMLSRGLSLAKLEEGLPPVVQTPSEVDLEAPSEADLADGRAPGGSRPGTAELKQVSALEPEEQAQQTPNYQVSLWRHEVNRCQAKSCVLMAESEYSKDGISISRV